MSAVSVEVNGRPRDVPGGTSVQGLLELLALAPERVAVERNGRLVRRAEHAATLLAEGDRIEIVTLVGGG